MKEMRAGLLIIAMLMVPTFCTPADAKGLLKVAFLDIGQGDAIYIEAPNGNQMIIDGGPAGSLTGPLSSVMPFGDRSVNVLMVTNPDTDHYAGFVGLLESGYSVGAVIEPGTRTNTPTHVEFQRLIAKDAIPEIMARKGMTIDIDKESGVTFTVLFPDRDVSFLSTNDGSIQGILSYGTTKIYFTGDGSQKTEGFVLASGENVKSDILKIGHHGSSTSSSDAFVKAVAPKYAVISSGKGNSYGLPKQITLDTLKKNGVEILRTDTIGTIIFTSDGSSFTQAR